MCRKSGYADVISVGLKAEFDAEVSKNVDKSAMAFGPATPRLGIDLLIIDWDTPSKGYLPFIKSFKQRYSGRYGILVIADPKHQPRFMMASKAGTTAYLIKPFKQSDFKEKIAIALSGKAEPIIQSFSMGGGSNPFEMQTVVEKKQTKRSPAELKALEKLVNESSKPAEPEKPQKVVTVSKENLAKGAGGGASFHSSTAGAKVLSDEPTATLVDGKINGQYHEKVNVIGGGENCYWAEEVEGKDKVRLAYLNAKGDKTNLEAKVIPRHEFMHSFFLCTEHLCQILKNAK